MEIKHITNEEVIELNAKRIEATGNGCIKESGECWIVKSVLMYMEGDVCEVRKVAEINALATEGEAREFAAKLTYNQENPESCIKAAYTIEPRWVF